MQHKSTKYLKVLGPKSGQSGHVFVADPQVGGCAAPFVVVEEPNGQPVPTPARAWVRIKIVYSDLVGYQTSDIRLLWTITPNPPPPHPNTLSTPPPPCQTSPPPRVPPISNLSHCHHTLEV